MVSPNVAMAEVTIEQQPPLPFLLLRRVSLKLQRDQPLWPYYSQCGLRHFPHLTDLHNIANEQTSPVLPGRGFFLR